MRMRGRRLGRGARELPCMCSWQALGTHTLLSVVLIKIFNVDDIFVFAFATFLFLARSIEKIDLAYNQTVLD